MNGPRTMEIGYGEFWLLVEDGRVDTSRLSVCGWCSAIVINEQKHTQMHSCGCSATFRVELPDVHDAGNCPLATDCGGQTWDPPCGGCDRCIRDQTAYYAAKERTSRQLRADPVPSGCVVHLPTARPGCRECDNTQGVNP